MRALNKREKIIKAVLFLPDEHIENIYKLIHQEPVEFSHDPENDLFLGLKELGQVMRGELEAIDFEDALNEL